MDLKSSMTLEKDASSGLYSPHHQKERIKSFTEKENRFSPENEATVILRGISAPGNPVLAVSEVNFN